MLQCICGMEAVSAFRYEELRHSKHLIVWLSALIQFLLVVLLSQLLVHPVLQLQNTEPLLQTATQTARIVMVMAHMWRVRPLEEGRLETANKDSK